MGRAEVDGRNGTFKPDSFSPVPFGGKTIETMARHPLYSALYDLRLPFGATDDTVGARALVEGRA